MAHDAPAEYIGRRPSDEVVKRASDRYVLQAWASGHPPSPEWKARNIKHQTSEDAMMYCVDNDIPFDNRRSGYR